MAPGSGCLVQNSTNFLGSPKPAFDACVGYVWEGVRANTRPQGCFQKKAGWGEAAEATGRVGAGLLPQCGRLGDPGKALAAAAQQTHSLPAQASAQRSAALTSSPTRHPRHSDIHWEGQHKILQDSDQATSCAWPALGNTCRKQAAAARDRSALRFTPPLTRHSAHTPPSTVVRVL